MIDHMQATGTNGMMEIQDKTDTPANIVDLWMYSYPHPVAVPNMAWWYEIDGVRSSLQSFNFQPITAWQHISTIYVGYASTFKWHLEDTGNIYTGGPTDFQIDLLRGSTTKTVSLKVGDTYKRAIPFVKDGGVWKPAIPYVMVASEWKEATN